MGLLIRWLVNAIALYIVAYLVPGVHLANFWTALVAVVVIGLINALVKPILLLLTLPINILTLGLFTFVLNAILLLLAAYVIPGFTIDGFLTAFVASILLSIISTILHTLVK
jgi:putative membrane protein